MPAPAPISAALLSDLAESNLYALAQRFRYLSGMCLRLRMVELTRKYTGFPPTSKTSYDLYQAVMDGPTLMTEQEATELAGFEMECGGWFLFEDLDPDDEAAFIPTHEWRTKYAQWLTGATHVEAKK